MLWQGLPLVVLHTQCSAEFEKCNSWTWIMKICKRAALTRGFPPLFSPPFLFFCETLSFFQEMHTLTWRFPGKVTLPKAPAVIWKPLSAPAVARGRGTAVNRVCYAGRHSAGLLPLIPQSSLRPLTFQSKLQSSSLSFMEVEKWLKRQKPRLKKLWYGTACFFFFFFSPSSFTFVFIILITAYTRRA